MTEEHKQKISLALKGKVRSSETKEKVRQGVKSFFQLNPEARLHISEINKNLGKVPPSRKGTKITELHKQAIRDACSGVNNYHWKGGIENARMHGRLSRARRRGAKGSFTLEQWATMKEAYRYTCPGCGKREPEIKLTTDHIIPLVRGGLNDISNIQPLCKSCNSKKRDKLIPKYEIWRGK